MRERLPGETTSVLAGDFAYSLAMAAMRSGRISYLVNAALSLQSLYRLAYLAARKLLDDLFQLRVFLAHDLFQLRRLHARVLELRERLGVGG